MFQLEIECQNADVDALSTLLEKAGSLSQTLTDKYDDAILEPELGTTPLWPDIVLQALFAVKADLDVALKHMSAELPHLTCHISNLPEQDWERVCLDDFKPLRFGNNLWITPSWLTPPEPDAVNLILDPGLAFGTGTHATTSLCLEWIEQTAMTDKTIIDYGCGSGVIALAALKLGARHAYAVDIDAQAIQASRQNAALNSIDETSLSADFPDALNTKADILIANILLSPLLTLKEVFSQLIKEDGILVVSGILKEQAPDLIEAYKPYFKPVLTLHKEDWALLTFQPAKQAKR